MHLCATVKQEKKLITYLCLQSYQDGRFEIPIYQDGLFEIQID
jgi:hypothetical protein